MRYVVHFNMPDHQINIMNGVLVVKKIIYKVVECELIQNIGRIFVFMQIWENCIIIVFLTRLTSKKIAVDFMLRRQTYPSPVLANSKSLYFFLFLFLFNLKEKILVRFTRENICPFLVKSKIKLIDLFSFNVKEKMLILCD